MTRRLTPRLLLGAAVAVGLGAGLWLPGPAPPAPRARRTTAAATPARMLGPGVADQLPDVALTTHRGEPVRVVTDLIRGRVAVLNFMYTRCDGSCPGTSAVLQELRPKVTAAFGPAARLVSITLDPAADTPAALAEYADRYDARDRRPDQADWVFLTGPPADVDRLRRAFGLADPDPAADAVKSQHAAVLTFGNDTTNRWSAQPAGLGPDVLWRIVLRTAGTTPEQRYGHLGRERTPRNPD